MNEMELEGFGGDIFRARVYVGIGKLNVITARGEVGACSGDVILTGPTGEVTVLTPQTAHTIFGDEIMPLYMDRPELLGLSIAEMLDRTSPTHKEQADGSSSGLRAEEFDPTTGEVLNSGVGNDGAPVVDGPAGDGTPAAAPVETEEARRLREGLERARAFQSTPKA